MHTGTESLLMHVDLGMNKFMVLKWCAVINFITCSCAPFLPLSYSVRIYVFVGNSVESQTVESDHVVPDNVISENETAARGSSPGM